MTQEIILIHSQPYADYCKINDKYLKYQILSDNRYAEYHAKIQLKMKEREIFIINLTKLLYLVQARTDLKSMTNLVHLKKIIENKDKYMYISY